MDPVILSRMKTAVSIPDDIFQKAEETARTLRMSRSELYAKAVEAFVKQYQADAVTATLNTLYEKEESGLDPKTARMQAASLEL